MGGCRMYKTLTSPYPVYTFERNKEEISINYSLFKCSHFEKSDWLKPFQTFMIWVFAYSAKAKHYSRYCKTQTIHSRFHLTLQSRNNSHFRVVKMYYSKKHILLLTITINWTLSALFCFDDWFEKVQNFYGVSIFLTIIQTSIKVLLIWL